MRLFDFALAPNPRRVRMFLAEKSVEIPMVQVNTREREQFDESFVAKNPLKAVPVLELDDGTCISESVAICRYIEEIHPEPALMGRDAKDKAIVEMWNRRVELPKRFETRCRCSQTGACLGFPGAFHKYRPWLSAVNKPWGDSSNCSTHSLPKIRSLPARRSPLPTLPHS